ncbi:MAG: amidase family protein, partial [Thermodesulfobacteriota bacterium]|nr:amidase family protein [Thermodesulfobacteriota bacterium]
MELYQLSAHKLHEMLVNKEINSREVTESVLKRIAQVEDRIHAFITLTPELAMQQAALADAHIQMGNAGPLTGIPLAIKDLICTRGVRTTCGSH